MSSRSRWLFWLFVGALVVVATTASIELARIKADGLAYHTRDYAYYLEFVVRAFDPSYPQAVSENPSGDNVFRFMGIEASKSLHQAIHLEPPKYAFALLFKAFDSVTLVYGLYALLYFLPLVYFARRARSALPPSLVCALAAAYVVWPANLVAPTYDLRPFVFFGPALLVALSAFLLGGSARERLASVVLLLVREEGLLFALPLLGIAAIEGFRDAGIPGAWSRVRPLALLWGAAAVLVAAYFAWAGFDNDIGGALVKYRKLLMVAAGGLALAWPIRALAWRYATVVLGGVPFVLLAMQAVITFMRPEDDLLADTHFAVVSAALLPVVAAVLGGLPARVRESAPLFALVVLALPVLALADFRMPAGFVSQYARAQARSADARIVHEVAAEPRDGYVMVDYDTHQAFYLDRKLVNYERVPVSVRPGAERYYPANASALPPFVDAADVIVISARSLPDVLGFAGDRFEPAERNDSYVVLRPKGR